MTRLALVAMLVLCACPSSQNPDLFPLPIADGEICSDVLEPPLLPANHVTSEVLLIYNTDPPTSGPHFDDWAPAGIYEAPIPDGNLVHNLEHGQIVIHHRDATQEELAPITAAVGADAVGVVMSPRPGSPFAFTLTSWGRAQVCSEIPANAPELIEAFIDAHRGQPPAPEASLFNR